MKEYTKPTLVEEKLVLEDIIAVSYSNTGDGDTNSWQNIFNL